MYEMELNFLRALIAHFKVWKYFTFTTYNGLSLCGHEFLSTTILFYLFSILLGM